jgi:NAD(P)H-hydrate repair Nnr-like enzyme with NAD(P)H-hydrate dehydratase domain
MASAGMGDVLSGILGAFLAQKLAGAGALVLGVHLHGAAGDAPGHGVGLPASVLIEPSRAISNRWLASNL